MKTLYKITLFFALLTSASNILGQQTEREKGIELYKQGDFKGAIEKLTGDGDATALHYLGLAFESANQPNDAAEAFENSFKTFYAAFERNLMPDLIKQLRLRRRSFLIFENLVPKYQLGAASAENAVRLKAKMAKQNEWLGKANTLVGIIQFAKAEETFYSSGEIDKAIKITKKPMVRYTDNARENAVSGTVRLMVVFGFDGKIKHIIPVVWLPNGLTEEAVRAAKGIKFEPAVKDGKPVSVVNSIEYSFSIR